MFFLASGGPQVYNREIKKCLYDVNILMSKETKQRGV